MADERHHEIVNVSHRGILGGWVNWCSCGASIVESDGGHDATDAHLAGPPQAPRPRKTWHFTDAEMAAHDAEVARAAAEKAWDTAVEMCCTMLGARNVNWPNPYRAAGGEPRG